MTRDGAAHKAFKRLRKIFFRRYYITALVWCDTAVSAKKNRDQGRGSTEAGAAYFDFFADFSAFFSFADFAGAFFFSFLLSIPLDIVSLRWLGVHTPPGRARQS